MTAQVGEPGRDVCLVRMCLTLAFNLSSMQGMLNVNVVLLGGFFFSSVPALCVMICPVWWVVVVR